MDPVILSRILFATTASVHFMFVPLTLGLSLMIAIMETVYVKTNQLIYRDMARFWGKLFIINFAVGVATGIPLEFQFGTNWSFYSHYTGDIFGAPLAIEGLVAFFLESTFIGLFIFGWDRLTPKQHLLSTWCVAVGSTLSALWILIANAWMQNPVGAVFNVHTMRMELASFTDVIFNPVAQGKFVHTVSGGYATAAMFVLAISAYYLLKKRDTRFARLSFGTASLFGLFAIVISFFSGDEAAYRVAQIQPTKLASMEALWDTEKDPALSLLAIPNLEKDENIINIRVPFLLGLLANRGFDQKVKGIKELREEAKGKIRSGLIALENLGKIRTKIATTEEIQAFKAHQKDLGYGMLMFKYTQEPLRSSDEMIKKAARNIVPNVLVMYLAFRLMLFAFAVLAVIFALGFFFSFRGKLEKNPWFLRLILVALPLPWIGNLAGWCVAEFGRQPWAIQNILPTHYAATETTLLNVIISLVIISSLGAILLGLWFWLLRKNAVKGPSVLKTGRYHFENKSN